MRSIIFVALILFIATVIRAQQFSVTITENDKGNDHSSSTDIRIGDKFYYLEDVAKKMTPDRKYVVAQKDEKGAKLKSSPTAIELTLPIYLQLIKRDDKLFFIYQERATNKSLSDLFVAEVDTNTLTFSTKRPIAALAKAGYDTKPAAGWQSSDRYYFESSPDSSKFLFFISNERSCENVYVSVTDRNYNVLWERMENLGRASDEISLKRAVVDNNGNVYLAYKLLESKKVKFPPSQINHIVIFNSKKKQTDKTFELGGAQLREIFLKVSPGNNKLIFGGLYAYEDREHIGTQGAFTGSMSLNDHVIIVRNEPFPKSLVEELKNDGWASTKGKYGVYNSVYPFSFELPDGSFGLIGEFRRTESTDKGRVYIIAGPVLYVNLNGKTPVFSRIPKGRVSAGTSFGDSYSAFAYQDKVIVFYNDNKRSLENDISEPAAGSDVYSNVVLVAAIINSDGTVRREKIVDLSKQEFMAVSHEVIRQANNIFLVSCLKVKNLGGFKGESKLARIEIK